MKKNIFKILSLLTLTLIFTSCTDENDVEKNYARNVEQLKNCAPYTQEEVPFQKEYKVDEDRAREIRQYFKDNTDLDLDALAASGKSTWEKAVELAIFVAKNIPHDNQKKQINDRNAITLWEYSREVKTGFNCRWHSILLSELLLSIGIKNSFVTCLPQSKTDGDCHVVNIVWLPEFDKWAMLDSDMTEYVIGEEGLPLSLEEMRKYIQQDKPFTVKVLPGFEKSWVAKESGQKYMQAYWAKNLYWFCLYKVYAFDLEYERNADGSRIYGPDYIGLVPPGYDSSHSNKNSPKISNAEVFWGK